MTRHKPNFAHKPRPDLRVARSCSAACESHAPPCNDAVINSWKTVSMHVEKVAMKRHMLLNGDGSKDGREDTCMLHVGSVRNSEQRQDIQHQQK